MSTYTPVSVGRLSDLDVSRELNRLQSALSRIENMTHMGPDDKDADFQEIVDDVCLIARTALAQVHS